jgi:hypothetical protein
MNLKLLVDVNVSSINTTPIPIFIPEVIVAKEDVSTKLISLFSF